MGLGEGADRAGRLGTVPQPLEPPDQHRPAEARDVLQPMDPAAVTDRDDPARCAAVHRLVGLDVKDEHVVGDRGCKHVHAVDTKASIDPGAPGRAEPHLTGRSALCHVLVRSSSIPTVGRNYEHEARAVDELEEAGNDRRHRPTLVSVGSRAAASHAAPDANLDHAHD